ncbi:hypothetical protein FGRMN_1668 [Fusarium graminum]|nr:hypothetical protein FGRMN_1668 [Fusarium graminum]
MGAFPQNCCTTFVREIPKRLIFNNTLVVDALEDIYRRDDRGNRKYGYSEEFDRIHIKTTQIEPQDLVKELQNRGVLKTE